MGLVRVETIARFEINGKALSPSISAGVFALFLLNRDVLRSGIRFEDFLRISFGTTSVCPSNNFQKFLLRWGATECITHPSRGVYRWNPEFVELDLDLVDRVLTQSGGGGLNLGSASAVELERLKSFANAQTPFASLKASLRTAQTSSASDVLRRYEEKLSRLRESIPLQVPALSLVVPRIAPQWENLGLSVARDQGGNVIVRGVPGQSESGPVDWAPNWPAEYGNETSLLSMQLAENSPSPRAYLPQCLLAGAGIHIEVVRGAGESSPSLLCPRALNHWKYADGCFLRVCKWTLDEDKGLLETEVCDIRAYVQSNLALAWLKEDGTLNDEQLARGKQLVELARSPLANLCGINILLFSIDGFMILKKRGTQSRIRHGEICSPISGSMPVSALPEGSQRPIADLDLTKLACHEVGPHVANALIEMRSKPRFLGFTRELIRGGDPELFFSALVALTAGQIMDTHSNDLDTAELFLVRMPNWAKPIAKIEMSVHDFWTMVKDAVSTQGHQGMISIPLLTNLVLWYAASHPDKAGRAVLPPVTTEGELRAP